MLDIDEIIGRCEESPGANMQEIVDFIEEMRVANSSAYYSEERRNKYLSLNISSYGDMLNTSRADVIKVGILKGKMQRATKFIPDVATYF